ncbi:MAG: glucosaminidase domain-containing protein [Bacteroidales bacterium]|nr:glucosaminidase domain-containing protein [Bacteroidales bacterium]
MMIRKLLFFLIITPLLFSCSNDSNQHAYEGFSEDELQFIARYDHELLNTIARKTISVQEKSVESADEIEIIKQKQVKPLVYNQLLSTRYMEKNHQKNVFIAQILPQVLITKFYLDQQRQVLEMLMSEDSTIEDIDHDERQAFIEQQMKKHGVETVGALMDQLTTHPTSIILAQAAIESNWGSTRSYEKANNPFQIRSINSSEPRLETFGKDSAITYLKKYEHLPASIVDYFRNINRSDRLADFREQRQTISDPFKLVQYLESYQPAYGEKYIQLLTNVIRRNDLTRYDSYEIDSTYINILTKDEIRSIIEDQTKRERNIVSSDSDRIKKIQSRSVDIQYTAIDSPASIVDVNSKYVVPYVYTNVIDLKYLPLEERKEKFIDMLLPSVLTAAYGIKQTRQRITTIQERMARDKPISEEDSVFLTKQLKDWRAENTEELLKEKMITRPISIMLAQAALETGWGSSRFFIAANNVFGVWSFDPNESRIRALGTRDGTPVYVKKYGDLSSSIIDYYKVIAKGPYDEYRQARKRTRDPYVLVEYLFRYSEMGQEYINRLKTVMRKSNLVKYDNYQLDPSYIKVE